MACSTGWTLAELDAGNAAQIVRTASLCVAREAQALSRQLAIAAASQGSEDAANSLARTIDRWLLIEPGDELRLSEEQRRQEQEFIRVCVVADDEELERLELWWEHRLQQRREKEGKTAGAPTQFTGNLLLLAKRDRFAELGLRFNQPAPAVGGMVSP